MNGVNSKSETRWECAKAKGKRYKIKKQEIYSEKEKGKRYRVKKRERKEVEKEKRYNVKKQKINEKKARDIHYWTKTKQTSEKLNIFLLPQIVMKHQWFRHRKWLFSLIIVINILLVVGKGQFSKQKIFLKYQKLRNF